MSSPKMMRSGGGLQKGQREESGSEMASRSVECGGPYYLRAGGSEPRIQAGAGCSSGAHLLDFGIPVFHILLVRYGGREKGNVLGAADPAGGNGWYACAPGFGDAVMAVDQVVASGCDLGEQDRAR